MVYNIVDHAEQEMRSPSGPLEQVYTIQWPVEVPTFEAPQNLLNVHGTL